MASWSPSLRVLVSALALSCGGGCSFDLSAAWPDAARPDGPHDGDRDATPDAPTDAVPDAPSGPPGTTRWIVSCGVGKTFTDAGSVPASVAGAAVAVDAAGNTYVAGAVAGPQGLSWSCGGKSAPLLGDFDVLVLKLDPQGVVQWVVTAGGEGQDAANAIAVTPAGVIYVAGYFDEKATFGATSLSAKNKQGAFVARLTPAGAFKWVRHVTGDGALKLEGAALTSDGAVVAAGWADGTYVNVARPDGSLLFLNKSSAHAGTKEIVITRIDASGETGWLTSCGGGGTDSAESVAVRSDGQIYVAGYSNSSDLKVGGANLPNKGGSDALVLAVGSTGTVTAGVTLGGSQPEEGLGVAVAGTGPVVTGWFRSKSATFGGRILTGFGDSDDDLFVARCSADLSQVNAARGVGDATAATGEAGFGVALLPDGQVVVVGESAGAYAFGKTLVSAGKQILIGRLSSALVPQAAVTAAVGGGRAWDVAVGPQGELHVAGSFKSSMKAGAAKVLSASGYDDLFVWKLTPP